MAGATGNVGRPVVAALAERDEVSEIIGLAGTGAVPAWAGNRG